jgi:diguanylate cyclase (GGDEF)-like protein
MSLQRGNLLRTGYLLSIASFSIVAIGAFTFPDFYYLVSAGFMIPILISGAIIGGASSSLFAGLTIATNAAALVLAVPQSPIAVESIGNIVFLFTHSIAAIAAAVVLQNLSRQVNRTINSLHRQADQMAKLAHTDPLTGLANRRFLFEQLESEFARARRYTRPFSLLYIDLDGFKSVNDQFGHLFGDEILRGCAKAMQAVLRTTDLLARIGGDEFAVLMPETRLQGSINAASKLRKALAAYSRQLSSTIPTLTFSVGISEITDVDEAIEDILSRADRAQYLAKSTGKSMTRTQEDLQESLSVDSS